MGDDSFNSSFKNDSKWNDSFIFSLPSTKRRFRNSFKRRRDDDDILLKIDSSQIKKKKKKLTRVSSLASFLTPMTPAINVRSALQRSLSSLKLGSLTNFDLLSENDNYNGDTTPSRQIARSWIGSFTPGKIKIIKSKMTPLEIKRQEAINELYISEQDLVEDLKMVLNLYQVPLQKINLLPEKELDDMFSPVQDIIPIHEDIIYNLSLQLNDSLIEHMGEVFLDWVPKLDVYVSYCTKLISIRMLYDEKLYRSKAFSEFVDLRREHPQCRKLDLWSFIDVPRGKLVKYPLLVKNILKYTPVSHKDHKFLSKSLTSLDALLSRVNKETGLASCKLTLNRLCFPGTDRKEPALEKASYLLFSGTLRNNRGTKLNAFLFDTCFVLSQPTSKSSLHHLSYQVYRDPIPGSKLKVLNLSDGEVKFGGSFKSHFSYSTSDSGKYAFKVFNYCLDESTSYCLQAGSEFSKRQWLENLNKVAKECSL